MADRNLSPVEIEDARRLKQIWNAKKEALNLSQVRAAKELGYTSQGAISQYINGKVALNFHATARFAKLLRVEIREISPRFGQLVTKPVPSSLDGFMPPAKGNLNGVPTDIVIDWFAIHKSFAAHLDIPVENLKFVRIEDGSCKELPEGSVVLVDDRDHTDATDGIYLFHETGKVIARRVTIQGDSVVMSGGSGKKQQMSKDVFALIKVVGRVLSVIKPVV